MRDCLRCDKELLSMKLAQLEARVRQLQVVIDSIVSD